MEDVQQEIINDFSVFDDWLDKYNYLIELGGELGPMDNQYRNDKYLIEGCQSRVWLAAEYRDGKLFFSADSDAIITKGIVALLIRALSGRTPQQITDCDLHFINAIGLTENLSPTRSNGLLSMVRQMKLYAAVYEQKNSPKQTES